MDSLVSTLAHLGIAKLSADQPQVGSDYIERLETALGVALPQDYREFLHTFGTCVSNKELIFRVQGDWLAGTDIFFGADSTGTYDIFENWQTYRESLPAGMLPIGTDPGGDLLCLGMLGSARGKVYFWHAEANMGEDSSWEDMYEIADSLPAFFQQLQIEPEA